MRNFIIIILIAIVSVGVIWFFFFRGSDSRGVDELNAPLASLDLSKAGQAKTIVTFKTNRGDIVLELFTEEMPITTGNFLRLAQEGFYNGTKFHRVISGFMIQGGDPNSKGDNKNSYGQGGPGYTIQDEFVAGFSNIRGTIAMANIGQPNSGGSQFFINLGDNLGLDFDKEPLASKHPVFGIVIDGMDVVDAIASVPTGQNDIPIEPVIINEIVVGE